MRAVVSQHCSVRMPQTVSLLTPCRVRNWWRFVVGNALCAVLVSTGSPGNGSMPSIRRTNPRAGSNTEPDPGREPSTHTTASPALLAASASRLTRGTMSGLEVCRQSGSWRKEFWTSMTMRASVMPFSLTRPGPGLKAPPGRPADRSGRPRPYGGPAAAAATTGR